MTTGNQTLLLSGSLLSNAASELAQTLRSDLLQLLDEPVSSLSQYGLSDACISKLQSNGFVLVTDLNFLQLAHLRTMGFPVSEIPLLSEICNEVRRTISVGSLSKILKNASENITQIAANLPIKNTFIDFPSLFPGTVVDERHPQSCPAFFLDDEKRAIAELEASIKGGRQVSQEPQSPTDGAGRPGEPSRGSADHGTGNCKPCAWYHHAEGCRHAFDCEFCHMCPVGEIKKRKKEKQKLIKSMKVVTDINHQNEVAGRETPPINISQSTSASTTPAGPHHQRSGISNWIGSIFAR
jgi:hypothetical protein